MGPPQGSCSSALDFVLSVLLSAFCLVRSHSNVFCSLSPLACSDPFSSSETVDDAIPNLNPFLAKLVVEASHAPVVSPEGVSLSSRTTGHDMFSGKHKSFVLFLLTGRVCVFCLCV